MKRIGYIIPYTGNIQRSHSLMNSIELLRRAGYAVDVFKCRLDNHDSLGDVPISNNGVTWHLMPLRREGYGVHRVLRWLRFSQWVTRQSKGKKYACFIAVDHAGLIIASWVARWREIPVIYYSLELWVAKDQRKHITLATLEKPLERQAHRRALFTIIQDEFRAEALARENGVSTDTMMLVPHSPMGEAYHGERTYLREKFQLPEDQRIILSSGSTNSTNQALEVAQTVRNWPPDWTLILHGNVSSNVNYEQKLRKIADGHRVILSEEQVPYAKLFNLVASADVGLALYPKHNVNHRMIASGKFADYARCGLPVVATDHPPLKKLMDSHNVGRCITTMDEVPKAIKEILSDYSRFQNNAYRCYSEALEYSQAFQAVLDKFAAL
jgi:glycosyltransferase involved in cell wall biosynthesis